MSKGKIIVISGASGAGKSTVIHKVTERHTDKDMEFFFSVSVTTRQPREGKETDGVDYYFITEEKFQEMYHAGDLLESNFYAGTDHYGTPATPIFEALDAGKVVVLDIDPNGAFQVRERLPEAVLIFITPPTREELRRRLVDRKDTTPEQIARRLERSKWECQQAHKYDYVVVNDDLNTAVLELESILLESPEAEKLRYEINHDVEILKEAL